MAPIDYRIDVQNPVLEAMKGFNLAQTMALQRNEIQRQQQAQQRQAQIQEALGAFAQRRGKTIEDYRNLAIRFPELSEQVQQTLSNLSEEQRQGRINRVMPIYAALKSGNKEIAGDLVDEQISASKYSQDPMESKNFELIKRNMELDPRGALTAARIYLYSAMGEDKFAKMDEQLFDAEKRPEGADNIRMSEFLPDKTMVGVTQAGEIIVKDVSGRQLFGDEAKRKIEEAQQKGIDLRAEAAKAEAEARQSVEQVKIYSGQIDSVNSDIGTLEEARNILDTAMEEDKFVGVGPIAQYLPAITSTSQEMRNVARRLGLGVISSATFGALSEGELKLAMDTAMPKGLKGPALMQWIEKRIVAKRKLADQLNEAVQFLGGGGTIAQWRAMQAEMRKNPALSSMSGKTGQEQSAPAVSNEPTAINPSTGQRIVYREGAWRDMQSGNPIQ